VTAVDPSERLLGVALAAARERDLDITCAAGEAADLPVPDGGVDCLLSNFGVVFAPDHEAAAAEMARVLAPGGRLLYTAWVPSGAVLALAATAQELVRATVGAPPPPPGFPWHDQAAVAGLFSPHGLSVAVEGHGEIMFSAPSAEAYLEAEWTTHPMALAASDVLRQHGRAEQARDRLLRVLVEQSEDPTAFRCTSRYVVLSARSG
jgi:SAM-dependent methyltransferase